jgi:alpha-N-arabinofuranosidase
MTVTVSNLHASKAQEVVIDLGGHHAGKVEGRVLSGNSLNDHNTFDRPAAVVPAALDVAVGGGGRVMLMLPPRSVAAVTLR